MESVLQLTLRLPDNAGGDPCVAAGGADWLTLSQGDWPSRPAANFSQWLADNRLAPAGIEDAFSLHDRYLSVCDAQGNAAALVYVSVSRDDLEYQLDTSYGTLAGPIVEDSVVDRTYTVQDGKPISLDGQVTGLESAAWEGAVWGADGLKIDYQPEVTLAGSCAVIAAPGVTGALRLTYTTRRHRYDLTLPQRPDKGGSVADSRSALVVAHHAGGTETLSITPVPDIGNCNRGSRTVISPAPGQDDRCYNREITYDYCSGAVISDVLVQVPCPQEAQAGQGGGQQG